MGERYWQQVEWSDGSPPVVTPVGPSMTREEVLAEIDADLLAREVTRRIEAGTWRPSPYTLRMTTGLIWGPTLKGEETDK